MRVLLVGPILALTAGVAHAGPLERFQDTQCEGDVVTTTPGVGHISNDAVILKLLHDYNIEMDLEVYQAFQQSRLGTYVREQMERPSREDHQSLIDLERELRTLLTRGPDEPEGEGVKERSATRRGPFTEGQQYAFLNRQNDWFVVRCPIPTTTANSGAGDGGGNSGGRRAADPSFFDRTIIGASVEDLDRSPAKRKFATLSYENDYEADDEIIAANIFVGLPQLFSGHARPYILYQRATRDLKPLNDLTFGLSGFWMAGENALSLNLEHETDDEFDSEVNRFEFRWEPVWLEDRCARGNTDVFRISCTTAFAVDSIQIQDPGAKTALQGEDSFDRYGFDFSAGFARDLPADGTLTLDFGYSLREPFDTDGPGDAAIGKVELAYQPNATSPYNIGLEYTNGDDITSFEQTESIKLTFGFRH